jgi:prepilin-type N-terminal cleavage/methylation domain-containing protein
MSRRRGFTLVELVVALTLALLVAGVVHRQLVHGQRILRSHAELAALQDNVRVAALVLAGELGPLGHDEITPAASAALGYPAEVRSDLLAIAPGSVTYLAARGGGHVCAVAPGAPADIVLEASSWQSPRAPRAGDSLLVYAEGDPAAGADDAWLHLGVVAGAGAGCPGGRAGIAIRVALPLPLNPVALGRISPGAPARLAEVMEMRYYRSGGKAWFGMRSVSAGEVIQPVAGPLADSVVGVRGLTLLYRDAAGNPTSNPAAVRAVEIELLGVTDQPIHRRNPARAQVDSFALAARVALRNGLRP